MNRRWESGQFLKDDTYINQCFTTAEAPANSTAM